MGLNPQIQTCHGFRKYFENALDDANIDHEKKMIIEGHFAGTRARHYTDRDVEGLRELYDEARPFIRLGPEDPSEVSANFLSDNRKRFAEIESKLALQNILEARLVVLEDELRRVKNSSR